MKSVLYRLVAIRENKLINWKERITTLEWIQNLSKRIALFYIRVYFCLFLILMPLQGFRIDRIFHLNILLKLTPSPSNLFEKNQELPEGTEEMEFFRQIICFIGVSIFFFIYFKCCGL